MYCFIILDEKSETTPIIRLHYIIYDQKISKYFKSTYKIKTNQELLKNADYYNILL